MLSDLVLSDYRIIYLSQEDCAKNCLSQESRCLSYYSLNLLYRVEHKFVIGMVSRLRSTDVNFVKKIMKSITTNFQVIWIHNSYVNRSNNY